MLYELYQFLTTPCTRPVKDVGYLREMIGMAARRKRCRAAWAPHMDQCKGWIVQAMEACDKREKVVVLGSGLLNDVPLAELSQGFGQVVLIDILHMPLVRNAVKAMANVTLDERDICGIVDHLYTHQTFSSPDSPDIPFQGADLVISLNIASQLPVLPREYATKHNIALGADMAAQLISSHLEALVESTAHVCLITEIEQKLCQSGQVIEATDALAGVVIPDSLRGRSACWDWRYAPHPERHPKYDMVYRVEGLFR
jgi:hypothetical protein